MDIILVLIREKKRILVNKNHDGHTLQINSVQVFQKGKKMQKSCRFSQSEMMHKYGLENNA